MCGDRWLAAVALCALFVGCPAGGVCFGHRGGWRGRGRGGKGGERGSGGVGGGHGERGGGWGREGECVCGVLRKRRDEKGRRQEE